MSKTLLRYYKQKQISITATKKKSCIVLAITKYLIAIEELEFHFPDHLINYTQEGYNLSKGNITSLLTMMHILQKVFFKAPFALSRLSRRSFVR